MTIRQVIEQVSREHGFEEGTIKAANFFASTNVPEVVQYLDDEATEHEVEWIRKFVTTTLKDPKVQKQAKDYVDSKLKTN